jgi:probable F420-dependent oxidoreductase
MRFGFSLPHYGFSVPGDAPISFETVVTWARRAEELGFDSVWISDHFFYSFARYGADTGPIAAIEPLTALAGLAAVTERVRLGTLVLSAPFRHPAIVAKMATTIDGISGGRFDLGVGAGWLEQEFLAFGYRYGTVGERFDALEGTLQVLHALSPGRPATLEGRGVSLSEARLLPRPIQAGGVPVWVGGKGGERLLRLAASYAHGWNAAWRWTPDGFARRAAAAREACERVGRDPSSFHLSVGLYSLVGESEGAFRDVFRRARASMPGDALRDDTETTWLADTLSGTPDRVIDRVRLFEAIGVEEIVVAPWVLPFSLPEPEQLDLVAERVLAPLRAGS